MAATERFNKARSFEREVYDLLQCDDRFAAVAVNGSESMHDRRFMELIRVSRDPGALLLRFAPDGVALTTSERVWYWDAKASDRLERDAYEMYSALVDRGCRVMLFCKPITDGNIYCQRIQRLRFLDSGCHVKDFPRPFPVVDDWICPRADNRYSTNDVFSGTPYRVIDLDSMVITTAH